MKYTISYRTKKLERCRLSFGSARRAWGKEVAERYHKCLDVLGQIQDLSELHGFRSLRFHALTGDRKGQFALSLGRRWRLIISVVENSVRVITVEKVTKHYED